MKRPSTDPVVGFASGDDGILEEMFPEVMRLCEAHDIIVTIPTDNDGEIGVSLDQRIPQHLGTATNGLITVGGVHINGLLAQKTTFDRGSGGSRTVYGLSGNVEGASYNSDTGVMINSKTSFAAPAACTFLLTMCTIPSMFLPIEIR